MSASKKKMKKVEDEDDEEVPEEIEEQCLDFHHSLSKFEKLLKPVLSEARPSHEAVSNVHLVRGCGH